MMIMVSTHGAETQTLNWNTHAGTERNSLLEAHHWWEHTRHFHCGAHKLYANTVGPILPFHYDPPSRSPIKILHDDVPLWCPIMMPNIPFHYDPPSRSPIKVLHYDVPLWCPIMMPSIPFHYDPPSRSPIKTLHYDVPLWCPLMIPYYTVSLWSPLKISN